MVVAGLAGWICQRLGLSSVVGFLLAGIVVGPRLLPISSRRFLLAQEVRRSALACGRLCAQVKS